MSCKIIYEQTNFPNQINPQKYIDNYYQWMWGKLKKIDEDTFELMQAPVGCKDYVVDTYWGCGGGFLGSRWTNQDMYSPFIYILTPNEDRYNHFLFMIQTVLNPWEESHGCTTTKISIPEPQPFNKVHMAVVEFDPKWMLNATAYSFFLSVLRICSAHNTLSFVKDKRAKWSCNESAYYLNLSPTMQILCNDLLKDPSILLVVPKKPFTNTGMRAGNQGHGATGIFNLAQYIIYSIDSNSTRYDDYSFFVEHLRLWYKEKYEPAKVVTPTKPITVNKHYEHIRPRNSLGQFIPKGNFI